MIDGRLPIYSRDGAERLQTFLRESCGLIDTVTGAILLVVTWVFL